MSIAHLQPTTMSTPASKTCRDAKAPFDRKCPKADVVLRSSDNVDFHFPKLLLIFASPVFENLLSDGKPDELKDGRPIILVHDSSKDLRQLLYFCHPLLSTPALSSIDDFVQLHAIAVKYCMEDILGSLEDLILNSPDVMSSAPLALYCLAIQYRFPVLARSAAKLCLTIDIGKLMGGSDFEDQLKHISAFHVNRLFAYHQACSAAINVTGIGGSCRGNHTYTEVHSSVNVFLKAMETRLKTRPCSQTVMEEHQETRTLERGLSTCSTCRLEIWSTVNSLLCSITSAINDAVSKVCLPLLFLFALAELMTSVDFVGYRFLRSSRRVCYGLTAA